jgi:uncharacterized protein
MAVIPLHKTTSPTGEPENFYVPHFQFNVVGGGQALRLQDVMRVTYQDNLEDIDSFEITVGNWDDTARTFRYEPPGPSTPHAIDPGTRVELWLGYLNNQRLVMTGEITTLEPSYPESGPPTLTIRGLNRLHSLRRKQHTWSPDKPMRISEVAKLLGDMPVSDDKPGLGLPVLIAEDYAQREPLEPFIFMNNQYDILFLLERARRLGYEVYLGLDENHKEFLWFGPVETLRDVSYELEWGNSLTSFRPTLTTARQVSQVTVRGWDRKAQKPIEGSAKLGDKDVPINLDQNSVAVAVQGRQEIVTDRPLRTQEEANTMARRILADIANDMVVGSGSTVGLPDLRAGRKVHIRGLGDRFNGVYFVTQTTHTLGEGYRTQFTAKRQEALPAKPAK